SVRHGERIAADAVDLHVEEFAAQRPGTEGIFEPATSGDADPGLVERDGGPQAREDEAWDSTGRTGRGVGKCAIELQVGDRQADRAVDQPLVPGDADPYAVGVEPAAARALGEREGAGGNSGRANGSWRPSRVIGAGRSIRSLRIERLEVDLHAGDDVAGLEVEPDLAAAGEPTVLERGRAGRLHRE